MRIGDLERLPSGRAASRATVAEPVIRRGGTPAGGLTVELDGRFITQFVVRADGSDDGPQCSADEMTETR